ncbi:cysteine proteinase [Hypoxylon sp. FL0543]|nr:cysteine proteinase [Hypoxylon sp. FL0543]
MDSIYQLDDLTKLRQLQWIARQNLQLGEPRALTSPRFLRQFLGSVLPDLNLNGDCTTHEMFKLQTQSFSMNSMMFLSVVCRHCHYHYHVKSDFRHPMPYNEVHPHHMLVSCQTGADGPMTEKAAYDDTMSNARYICIEDNCFFNIEISVVPSRIQPTDVAKLGDKDRTARNLALARAQDPDRYADFVDSPLPVTDGMLRRYLSDALTKASDRPLLKINKRNKKFLVSMGNDFDDLLRFLGFFEGTDSEGGEPCWYIRYPEVEQNPTRVRTLRARMEDALVELDILANGIIIPAWGDLLQAFQGDYPTISPNTSYVPSIKESDLAVLGCLATYPPKYFSWAAILLAKLRPRNRDMFLDAGLSCIADRSDDASTEIIMYKSQFDGAVPVDRGVQDAYAFFGCTPEDILTPEWFLNRYYELARSNSTDDFKAQAQQHLEVIGNCLGRDIVSDIDPRTLEDTGETGLMTSSPNGSGRRMSISSAAKFLHVEPKYTAEIIRGFVEQLVHDDNADRAKIVEAVDVLSELKRQQDQPEEAAELQQIAEFVKATGYTPMVVSQPHAAPKPGVCLNSPPGLKNIGNTCYLNSLLQYFYTVKVIRDLVLNFDKVKLELEEETLKRRRTGGNGTSVSLEEAIVARQFVEMLQTLFADLQTTTDEAAQPSQKLANIALSSARDILDQKSQNIPPPLPARPSPAPPGLPTDNGLAKDGAASDAVSVTVESVNDKLELASSRSSQTLVDETEDVPMPYVQLKTPDENASVVAQSDNHNDVEMRDSTASWSLDAKIAEISRRLEHSDRSGTSQQDVGEIIGNILEHFMRAIRSDGPMPGKPDLQADKITNTFFTMIVNYTIKTKRGYPANDLSSSLEERPLNIEIVPERWITAYPEEADQASDDTGNYPGRVSNARCTLYAALDRYFSYEPIDDGSRARYSSIRSLPPILHICIQRSTPKGKNKNPVIIPEILYLDRYMEAENGSPIWLARKKVWALKERLKELEAKDTQTQSSQEKAVESTATKLEFDKKWKDVDDADIKDIFTPLERRPEEARLERDILDDVGPRKKARFYPCSWETFLSLIDNETTPSANELPSNSVSDSLSNPLDDSRSNAPRSISLGDKLGDIVWGTSTPLDETARKEILELRQKEETAFDGMTKEKYSIHAVICHRGGTTAGHYWVWIRDFKRNIWYRYNDETVTEDSRGTEAVLKDLNETGDPYYVAYVRDEMKDELVDVPQRHKPEAENASAARQDVEMIEGVAFEPVQVPVTGGDSSA